MQAFDVVIPVRACSVVCRTVFEAVSALHRPRRIVVVAPRAANAVFLELVGGWKVAPMEFMDEEDYFLPNFELSLEALLSHYGTPSAKVLSATGEELLGSSREAGWWLQQLIKLGAGSQIPGLSRHYLVWDGDLVPLTHWPLFEEGKRAPLFNSAVLQLEVRSEFNRVQYAACMRSVLGLESVEPEGGGTSVTHHNVFSARLVASMLAEVEQRAGGKCWPVVLMSLSRQFYRFSEYKTYFSWMHARHPARLRYHKLSEYGHGLRVRDADRLAGDILAQCPNSSDGVSYSDFAAYCERRAMRFSYVQMDAVSFTAATSKPPRREDTSKSETKVEKMASREQDLVGPLQWSTVATTVVSMALIVAETGYRWLRCRDLSELLNVFSVSLALCLLMICTDIKSNKALTAALRPLIKTMHASDSLIALAIGVSLYLDLPPLLWAGTLCLNKFFLLHLICRMVTGVASFSSFDIAVQTTKTFFHHNGSFLFIRDPLVGLVTGVWRCFSMNAHAVLTIREYLDYDTYFALTLSIAHTRNCAMLAVLYLLHCHPLSAGFAASGVGHFSYVAVRLEAVFRLAGGAGAGAGAAAVKNQGSIYMSVADNLRWAKMTTGQRVLSLLQLNHLMLGLEVLLMTWLCVDFLYFRALSVMRNDDVCRA